LTLIPPAPLYKRGEKGRFAKEGKGRIYKGRGEERKVEDVDCNLKKENLV